MTGTKTDGFRRKERPSKPTVCGTDLQMSEPQVLWTSYYEGVRSICVEVLLKLHFFTFMVNSAERNAHGAPIESQGIAFRWFTKRKRLDSRTNLEIDNSTRTRCLERKSQIINQHEP
jgi:hypothetical protein